MSPTSALTVTVSIIAHLCCPSITSLRLVKCPFLNLHNAAPTHHSLAQMDRDAQQFNIIDVGFDRWGSAQVYQQAEKAGMLMVQVGQGYQSMSAPMKELERMIVSGLIAHGDNPVLTWMAHNLVAMRDPAGNLKPDKRRSREKIDGMVALIMALDRATRHDPDAGRSVYDEQDVREL